MVGNKNLHPNVSMVACGNLATDNAIVNNLSSALKSRVIHFELAFCVDAFKDYMQAKNFSKEIIGYINWRPENAHNFDPNHHDKTYPAPRTWEFLNNIQAQLPNQTFDLSHMALACGTVGQGTGTEFVGFCQLYSKLPPLKELLANPESVYIDWDDFGIVYALCSVIEKEITTQNAPTLMKLIKRMTLEMQVVCLINSIKRMPTLASSCQELRVWVRDNAKEIIHI